MPTKLIELDDGTLIEAEVPDSEAQQISGGLADRVGSNFEQVKPLLIKICKPISEVWKDLNQDMQIDGAEVEIGLSFEGEGNIYITKAKAGANLTVKLVLKPKTDT